MAVSMLTRKELKSAILRAICSGVVLGSVESVLVPPAIGTAANGNANPSKVASVGAVNACATAAMGYKTGWPRLPPRVSDTGFGEGFVTEPPVYSGSEICRRVFIFS